VISSYRSPPRCLWTVFLFAFQIFALTLRMLTILNTTTYFGKMLKIIKLMCIETIKFLIMYFIYIVGFWCGIWMIIIANSGDEDEDFEPEDRWESLIYTLQVFIGTGDLNGVVSQKIAQSYMVIATIFGTLILTNLLIALMTTKYEEVSEKAEAEVMLNQTELAYDLSTQTSRLMPPPLCIIPIVLAVIVWAINFVVAVVNPRWNLYAFLHHGTFQKLRDYELGIKGMCRRAKDTVCCAKADDGESDDADSASTDGAESGDGEQGEAMEPSTYFLSMTRTEVVQWHLGGLRAMISCCRCCPEQKPSTEPNAKYKKIHHKNCYGYLLVHGRGPLRTVSAVDGIRMAEYMERFEKSFGTKIHHDDRAQLNQLTSSTLFCRSCFQPINEERFEEELTSPFIALTDIISVGLLPIALLLLVIILLPIVFILPLLPIKWSQDEDDDDDDDE